MVIRSTWNYSGGKTDVAIPTGWKPQKNLHDCIFLYGYVSCWLAVYHFKGEYINFGQRKMCSQQLRIFKFLARKDVWRTYWTCYLCLNSFGRRSSLIESNFFYFKMMKSRVDSLHFHYRLGIHDSMFDCVVQTYEQTIWLFKVSCLRVAHILICFIWRPDAAVHSL